MEILVHFVCVSKHSEYVANENILLSLTWQISVFNFCSTSLRLWQLQYLWLHLQEIASCLATSSSKSCNQAKQDKTKQLKSKHFRFQHDTLMRQRQGEEEKQAGRRQGNVITLSATSFARLPAPPSFLLQLCLALWQWKRAPLRLCAEFLVSASISKLAYHA